jgi:myosin heavy subunit
MKSAVLTTALLTQSLQQASPLSIAPSKESPARQSRLFVPAEAEAAAAAAASRRSQSSRRSTQLQASTFAQNNNNPWGFLRFPTFNDVREEDRDVSLLSLEGGATKVTWPYLLSTKTDVMDEQKLVSEINSLSETFSDLQSSIDVKSSLYEETLSTYRMQLANLVEENSFLEEGMRMLTLTLEKQADEIAKLNNEKYEESFVRKLEEENEMLRTRVRGLEVELSDVAFESRKSTEPVALVSEMKVITAPIEQPDKVAAEQPEAFLTVEAAEVDLTPKAPTAPIPTYILQQRQVEELQWQLHEYEEERSSLRKLVGLCFKKSVEKAGKAMNLWRPVYLLLADARRAAFA